MLDSLNMLFDKYLDLLKSEIEAYPDEDSVWKVEKNIANSGGNLCLHLIGNLNHFIGNVLGNTGYVRKRDAEFGEKNIPREELIRMINETKKMIESSLKMVDSTKLKEPYPIEVFNRPMTIEYFLMHLLGHLEYHKGQINYHRRLTN